MSTALQVLINSISVRTGSCRGCSPGREGGRVSLTGEVIGEFLQGVPCSTATLDNTTRQQYLHLHLTRHLWSL